MLPKRLAVISDQDDQRVVSSLGPVNKGDQPFQMGIDEADLCVVGDLVGVGGIVDQASSLRDDHRGEQESAGPEHGGGGVD